MSYNWSLSAARGTLPECPVAVSCWDRPENGGGVKLPRSFLLQSTLGCPYEE